MRGGFPQPTGAERRTLLRASYSRFADQLQTSDVAHINPTGAAYVFALFDDTGSAIPNIFEGTEPNVVLAAGGFNPANPSLLETPNEVDPDFDPPTTDEIVLGVEHALLPEFVVGVDVTWSQITDIQSFRDFIIDANGVKRVARASDYVPATSVGPNGIVSSDDPGVPLLPDGSSWSAQFFEYAPGITDAGGSFLTNGDYERDYLGASLNFTKRLSNRWMARGYFQYGEAEWDQNGENQFDNPVDDPSGIDGTRDDPDGGLYVVQSAGSGPFENVFIQSTWSANLNGMYQVAPDRPWGFNLAGNVFAREGYPLLYTWQEDIDQLGEVDAAAISDVDQFRADDIWSIDLRIEKDMQFSDNLSGILSLDAFNVTNENHIMGREVALREATSNFVTQTLSPRIYRLGFRLNWR